MISLFGDLPRLEEAREESWRIDFEVCHRIEDSIRKRKEKRDTFQGSTSLTIWKK